MRPYAHSVCGLKLPVTEALSYLCDGADVDPCLSHSLEELGGDAGTEGHTFADNRHHRHVFQERDGVDCGAGKLELKLALERCHRPLALVVRHGDADRVFR